MDGVGLKAYVGVLAVLALALAGSWAYSFGFEVGAPEIAGTLLFAAVLALADAFPIRVGERSEISALDVGLVAAVVLLGPLWAAVAALPCALVTGRTDPLRVSYEAARNTVEIFLAGLVFSLAAPPLLHSADGANPPTAAAVYATLAAGATLVVANGVLDAGLLKAKHGQTFARSWEEMGAPYLLTDAVVVLTCGLSVAALLSYGPVAAVVLVAGSVTGQALVLRSREHAKKNRELEEENASLKRALSGAGTTFGSLVAEALGRRDGRADRRAAATAVYAADLAREMGLGGERAELVRLAGLLHDVGMVFLPEELLLAEGRPNSVAQRELAEHPALGEAALAPVPGYGELARWVRWHHERPDGRGYPDRLRGPWIPMEAKILAVAQAHAVLVLDGPTRPGVPLREARERLAAGMDTEFDGTVVKAFLRILDTESEGYRMADDDRFVLPGRPSTPGAADAPGRNAVGPPSS